MAGNVAQHVANPDRVQSRAQAALADSPFHELRQIRVDQQHGALALSGCVSSFYHKQLAQEVVRSVCREVDLVNDIRVRWSDES